MKLYLDQMLRAELAELLRAEGHEVARAEDFGQSRADDAEILARAISERRILVTLDRQFGDWAVLPLQEHPGVIRLRVQPTTTEEAAACLLPLLAEHREDAFENHLVIASRRSIRWIRTASR